MPSYLMDSRHISLSALGFDASLPYVFGLFGLIILGWLGNRRLNRYRASMIAVSYLLAGVSLYIAYSNGSVGASVAGLSGAAFFLYGGFGPLWSVALDLIPDPLRATFSGFVNFGGQIGGFIAPLVIGGMVTATGSYTGGFLFMIGGLVLAAISLFWLQGLWLKTSKTPRAA